MASASSVNFNGLVSRRQLRDLPPLQWLVKGIIPLCDTGTLAVFWGQPGSFKSFATLGMACAVSSGKPAWGHFPVQQSDVVYVAAEGMADLDLRLGAWEKHFSGDASKVHFLCRPLRVTDPDDVEFLVKDTKKHKLKPRLFVIDTWSRCLCGEDENQSSTVERAVASLDQLRLTFGAAVVVVHHSDKAGMTARGSGALKGAVDMEFEVRKEDGSESCLLLCRKPKYSAPPPR
jgi:hypothetical protein